MKFPTGHKGHSSAVWASRGDEATKAIPATHFSNQVLKGRSWKIQGLSLQQFDFNREASRTAGEKPVQDRGTRQKPPTGPQGKPITAGEFQFALAAAGNDTEAFPPPLCNKILHFLPFHSPPIQRRPSMNTMEQSTMDVPGLFAVTDGLTSRVALFLMG